MRSNIENFNRKLDQIHRRRREAIAAGVPRDEAFARSNRELAEAHEEFRSDGELLRRSPSGGGSGVSDFMTQAKKVAAEGKISVTAAIKQLKAEDPAAYERFRLAEQRQPLRIHGGKAAGRV